MTPTIYFDGKSARPQQVRVLFFNEQVHVYEEEEDVLLVSLPIEECSLDNMSDSPRIYLNPQRTSYLLPDPAQPVTAILLAALATRHQSLFSRLMKAPLAMLLGIFAVLVIGAYFLLTEGLPRVALYFISVQQEEKLGQAVFTSLAERSLTDSAASLSAQDFANHLVLSKRYPIKVYVVKNKAINAFALPGGIVVIYSGILKTMGSYEELAALLGHEVTHINDRHSLRSMLQQLSFSAFLSVVAGDASGIAGSVLSNAATLQSLSYSRRLETAADRKGMEILEENHIHPRGMLQLMERLQQSHHGMQISFLSTHPLTDKRMAAAKKVIQQHAHSVYTGRGDLAVLWQQLKSCLP